MQNPISTRAQADVARIGLIDFYRYEVRLPLTLGKYSHTDRESSPGLCRPLHTQDRGTYKWFHSRSIKQLKGHLNPLQNTRT